MRRPLVSLGKTDAVIRAKEIRVRDGISLHPLDDEAILADCTSQNLYRLNATAAFIWCCLEDGMSREQIVLRTAGTFSIVEAEAQRYVDAAIGEWLALSLLDDGSPAAYPPPRPKTDTAPAMPPPRRNVRWAAQRNYRLLDTRLRLRFRNADTAMLVDRYFAHLSDDAPSDTSPTILDLHEGNGCWAIYRGNCILERWVNAEELIPTLKIAFTTIALEGSRDFGALHAACIARVADDTCVLIAGISGSGKSTLTASLAASGFVTLGDDTIVLARDTLAVRPMPFRICLKSGSWPLLQQRIAGLMQEPIHRRLDGKQVRYCLPPNHLTTAPSSSIPAAVSGIVFPHRGESGRTAFLVPLSPADAAIRLIGEFCPLGGDLSPGKIDRFLRWLAAIPCLELRFSSLDEGSKVIEELLQ
jgi:coenzyme PQQ synthesis protein D (PqqD)